MSAAALLAREYDLMYMTAGMNLEGMTREHSLVQPSPGGNCANWILAHVVGVQNSVLQLAGAEPVWDDESLAAVGTDPVTGPDDAVDWAELVERFLSSRERCVAAVEGLSEETLSDRLEDPFGDECSRAELLGLLLVHQMYHVGQLGLSRRLAGLPGAIRGPEQGG